MERIPEVAPQEKESSAEVMEHARNGRLEILTKFFSRIQEEINARVPKSVQRFASDALDVTIVSSYKMGAEMIAGKTAAGDTLSPRARVMYGLIVGTNAVAWSLLAATELRMAAGFHATSWILFGAQKGPDIAKNLKEVAKKYGVPAAEKILDAFSKIDPQEIRELTGA